MQNEDQHVLLIAKHYTDLKNQKHGVNGTSFLVKLRNTRSSTYSAALQKNNYEQISSSFVFCSLIWLFGAGKILLQDTCHSQELT